MEGLDGGMIDRPDTEERPTPDLAVDVAGALYRAYRAVRFYPAHHPVAAQSLERLTHVLADTLETTGVLRFDVREKALMHDDLVVYGADNPRDSPAQIMFLDGIRSITFHPGLEPEEIVAFVQALVQAQEADREECDFATLLWELDLPHVNYQVVDPLLDTDTWEGKGVLVEQVRGNLMATITDLSTLDMGDPLEPELEPGDPSEGAPLLGGMLAPAHELEQVELALEEEPDILADFLDVLSEVLAGAQETLEVESAAHAISDVLHSYLEWGEFQALASAVERLRSLQRVAPQRQAIVDELLGALSTPEMLRKAVYDLDGARSDRRADLEELLYLLKDQAYPALVELLTEAGGKASRKCILNVCTRGEGVPVSYIAPRLSDPRWYVVRNMVLVLGSLGNRESLPHLERALDHPDERVRREAVRAISALGGHRCAYLLTSSLTDPAPSVRILAARSLPRTAREDAAAALLTQVTSRDFQSRDTSEIDAFFGALAEVADDRALPFLDELWSTRSHFRTRPMAVRLGALRVIGQIGSSAARDLLLKAARSGDEEIRRQAKKTLMEAERKAAGA
ncbi:MAG: HEAT repeat domain-containing protein [Thermoleophilia bacterium]